MLLRFGFLLFLLFPSPLRAAQRLVHPSPDPSSFANPYRGWVSWWENHEEPRQPGTLVFAYQAWRDTELSQGVYDFDSWDAKNLKPWADRGFHVILRLECDYPRKEAKSEIPQYIMDHVDHENEGIWYDKKEIGKGYAPDYNDPFLLENLLKFIKAYGAHYNLMESVAVVQLGTFGHWGEWHTWPDGSGVLPGKATEVFLLTGLKEAFPDKFLQGRYPQPWTAKTSRIGFHEDCWGELTSCTDGSWCLRWNLDYFQLWDRWKTAINGGEFCDPKQYIFGTEADFKKALDEIREYHASWLGPQAAAEKEPGGPYQARLDEMEKALGYRFVVEEAAYDDEIKPGQPWTLRLKVRNDGSAPFYFGWKPELALLDDSGKEVWSALLNQDLLTWLPGTSVEWTEALSLPPSLSPSLTHLTLALSLRDPRGPGRARFANLPVDTAGRLILSEVKLK